ncbi:UspA domain protein [Gloeothece citriformis PCC 7424]|uniref:UspA domain protein n=1 Tax=Gloeothece citriformis (strain PCC 7424) TaxID=65393 RepID=B7KJ76_GLOC7|nr:universal stress protein [Gloeothece citriformis]ACK72160.1 UspA domain protein [Gloeothece citriformis PCC 7424]
MTISKVLIAVDKTATAFKAAKLGFSLAESLKQAEVLLIHVIDPVWTIGDPDSGLFPEQASAKLRIETEDFLNQLIEMFGKNVKAFHVVLEGKIVTEIVQTAKNYDADILVLGVHPKTGFSRLFMEDVVKEISPLVSCPVLLAYDKE